MPTLCVSEPVLAPTTTIRRPTCSAAKRSISSSVMYSMLKPSPSSAVKSIVCAHVPYITK
jgi:hypothetical protein